MAKYYCPHCKKILERNSDKKWKKEYCETAGRDVHLQLIKKELTCQ